MNYSTYQEVLIQGKAYRAIRTNVTKTLERYDLSIPEWTLLGLLQDGGPQRISELALKLSVEIPHVTVLIRQLDDKGYVKIKQDPADSRAKIVSLAPKARRQLPQIGEVTQEKVADCFHNITSEDLTAYFKVLQSIIATSASHRG